MRNLLLLILMSSLLMACNDSVDESQDIVVKVRKVFNPVDYKNEKQEILALEDSLLNMEIDSKSKKLSQKLLSKSIKYADNYPKDTLSGDFLFLAARAANGLGQYHNSLDLMNRIIRYYKSYDHLAEVYFLKAFTYDENLNDKAKAKNAYSELMRKFPNDPLAVQAQFMLDNLYLTDKQLIEKFKSQ